VSFRFIVCFAGWGWTTLAWPMLYVVLLVQWQYRSSFIMIYTAGCSCCTKCKSWPCCIVDADAGSTYVCCVLCSRQTCSCYIYCRLHVFSWAVTTHLPTCLSGIVIDTNISWGLLTRPSKLQYTAMLSSVRFYY